MQDNVTKVTQEKQDTAGSDDRNQSASNREESELQSISEHISVDSISHDQSLSKSQKISTDSLKPPNNSKSNSFNDLPLSSTHETNNQNFDQLNTAESTLGEDNSNKIPEAISNQGLLDAFWSAQGEEICNINISSESPINLVAESSENSNQGDEIHNVNISSQSPINLAAELSENSNQRPDQSIQREIKVKDDQESHEKDSLDESEQFPDSLTLVDPSEKYVSPTKSSTSEEIIKLDIRGTALPKIPFASEKIIFGPPPPDADIIQETVDEVPAFSQFLSQFLVCGEDFAETVEDNNNVKFTEFKCDFEDNINDRLDQTDLLVEELMVDNAKEKLQDEEIKTNRSENKSFPLDPELVSMSTLTTDYKTICEEFQGKLVHFEEILSHHEETIDRLTASLHRSDEEKEQLKLENAHLTNEVQNLQHYVGENMSHSEHTVKGQLSDLHKYESMIKDDSTKYHTAIMSHEPSSRSDSQSSNGEKDMDGEELTVNYSKSKTSETSDDSHVEFDDKLSNVISTLNEFVEENILNEFKDNLGQIFMEEIKRMKFEYEAGVSDVEKNFLADKQAINTELRRLNELLTSVKAGRADLEEFRQQVNSKHEKEMEDLRTYFEEKCSDMEKNYRKGVEVSACEAGSGGSTWSLEAACSAALPYASSLRAAGDSADIHPKQAQLKNDRLIEELKSEHASFVSDLEAKHRQTIDQLRSQIHQLETRLRAAEGSEHTVLYHQDIDLELERRVEEASRKAEQEAIYKIEEQIQVLLSEPTAELSRCPLDLVALRDRLKCEATHTIKRLQNSHQQELSQLRAELGGGGGDGEGGADKWRRRRHHSFDQNRQLDQVTKERDGLKRVACTLRRVVTQLVAYCAAADDELNRTVLTELLQHMAHNESLLVEGSCSPEGLSPAGPEGLTDLDSSALSRGKRVHFAPDLTLFANMDEETLLDYLQDQDDLSLEIKNELDSSLRRLKQEAHQLLDLSGKFSRLSLPSGARRALVMDTDKQEKHCENCETYKNQLSALEREGCEREALLRTELRATMIKLSLLTEESPDRCQLIAEGYGLATRAPMSLPTRAPPGTPPTLDSRSTSLDGSERGRRGADVARLAHELEAVCKERDDLQMQLEAANRQLRSTRQFIEEQTTEREAERDEFARQLGSAREENHRMAQRLQSNAAILSEVEQLEAQTKEMNSFIQELEIKRGETDKELKSTLEKISLLRDIITNLESQLEQKTVQEKEILEKLEEMRKTIDERDSKMRSLLGELESLKSEKEQEISCVKCEHSQDENDAYAKLMEQIKDEAQYLENSLHRRIQRLERIHEAVSSTSCSEPSEDVSIRDQKKLAQEEAPVSARAAGRGRGALAALGGVWECLAAVARAEEACVKRVRDLEMQRARLEETAQEVRAERDVLQQRMSEQALKISSLAARLEVQRTHAEALRHETTSRLSVRLHDATAEVQRLTEELETKDKQLARLRQALDEGKGNVEQSDDNVCNTSCQPKDKVIILERELTSAQERIVTLEALAKSLENDKANLTKQLKEYQRLIAEKEAQLHELLELQLDDNDDKDDRNEAAEVGKISARTLSDIVSISDYDEQDLQIRRAEQKHQNISNIPYPTENKSLNRTLPPELNDRPRINIFNLDHTVDHLDLAHYSPCSLPAQFTNNKEKALLDLYKRNINETTVLGTHRRNHQALIDNNSMYPNRDATDTKDVSIEPKKINFSHENSKDEFVDVDKMKYELAKSKAQVEHYQTRLKHAEEQLCEFPALKEEVDKLKNLLENTVGTMQQDKKFYSEQLESFTTTRKHHEKQLSELSVQVSEKSNDLHLLKEDILRRENMVMDLAKEKRSVVNKMTELEMKYDSLLRKNEILENHEQENRELKQKLAEFVKLEQLVSEKNLQIDNLNEHLNRLDDLQRCLDDKNEEIDRIKETTEEKINEIEHLHETIQAMSNDVSNTANENSKLIIEVRELKEKLSKVGRENETSSFQLKTSLSELEKMTACNKELSGKIEEMKTLTDQLKEKECEIEILNEDINYFHEEIASLRAELKMVSRSPSPKERKGTEEKEKLTDKKIQADKKELAKIRKHVAFLQQELAFNKKDLNEKAFELARAKLDITELKNNLSLAEKTSSDQEVALHTANNENAFLRQELAQVQEQRRALSEQLDQVNCRLREEGNLKELADKLEAKSEQCRDLEQELDMLKQTIERMRSSPTRVLALPCPDALLRSTQRSPTAELENAVRAQLSYSHHLDDSIMEQILSDHSAADVPALDLDMSRSSCTQSSSSARRLSQLTSENDKLKLQVANLEARLKDKEALITELNRIRDKLVQDWQQAKLQYETEKDNSGRLQLLLDTQKETSDSLQNQDSNMIQILKKRLESSMSAELELQQSLQQSRLRCTQLESRLAELSRTDQQPLCDLQKEVEERLRGEVALLKSRLERDKNRLVDLQHVLDSSKLQFQRDIDTANRQCSDLKHELAELRRQKHDLGVELVRARELIHQQGNSIAQLQRKSESEERHAELSRQIAALKQSVGAVSCLQCAMSPSQETLLHLKEEKAALQENIAALEREIASLRDPGEDKDQAVRVLHCRCLRLESCRKALVWQKRYLQRVVRGYGELENALNVVRPQRKRNSFKSVALAAVGVVRMAFLVRRRQHIRTVSADCLLRRTRDKHLDTEYRGACPSAHSPPSRLSAPAQCGRTSHHHSLYSDSAPVLRGVCEERVFRSTPLARVSHAALCDLPSAHSSMRDQVETATLLASRLESVSRRLHRVIDNPADSS